MSKLTIEDLTEVVPDGEWPIPAKSEGICDRWRQAFVCVRLQDALARLYLDTPFTKLGKEDRSLIRSRCEFFLEQMERATK